MSIKDYPNEKKISETVKKETERIMGLFEEREQRTEWFLDARFGMFIHWGLYAIPARGEWVRGNLGSKETGHHDVRTVAGYCN